MGLFDYITVVLILGVLLGFLLVCYMLFKKGTITIAINVNHKKEAPDTKPSEREDMLAEILAAHYAKKTEEEKMTTNFKDLTEAIDKFYGDVLKDASE